MHEATATQYLTAIWVLEERGHDRVGVTALTTHLGKAPATVSQAVLSLAATGLLTHKRYGPIALTPPGRVLAVAAIRRERIARAFLHQVLAWPWPAIAAEAAALSPALSDDLVERMRLTAGAPGRDPYGHPIPDQRGRITEIVDRRLSDFAAPATVQVTRIDDRDPGLLERFHGIGLVPNAAVEISELDRTTGVMAIATPRGHASVGLGSAERISAIPAGGP